MRKTCVFALLGSTMMLPAAHAGDLAPAALPVLAPTRVANWTGFYAGVNVGYGFDGGGRSSGGQTSYANTSGDTGTETHGPGGPAWDTSTDLNGVIGGAQIGYNWQISPWMVVGIEADFQGSGLEGDSSASDTTAINLFPLPSPVGNLWPVQGNASVSQKVDWYGTVRGRLGFTSFDNSLLTYVTGGLAYGHVTQDFNYSGGFLAAQSLGFLGSHWNGSASTSDTKFGWTIGAGVEWKPRNWSHWTIKAEYLFTDLGETTVNLSAPAFRNSNGSGGRTVNASNTMDTMFHTVRVGLNYRFN